MVDFARRPSPITKSFSLKYRPGEVLNFDGQTFGIRSWYGNYIAVVNFVCVVSFKRFPFYVRSYDAPELRNALEYARRMVRLLFGVEFRALHSDVFSSYYDYPVVAQWRTLHNIVLDMQPPEMTSQTFGASVRLVFAREGSILDFFELVCIVLMIRM